MEDRQFYEEQAFYKHHRGGQGAVVVVTAIRERDQAQTLGIFGSIETAHEWRRSLGDKYVCVFSPYIIDDPDWGNEVGTR